MDDMLGRRSVSAAIREKLDHPVIDADGHIIESRFVLPDFLKQVGGASLVNRFEKEMAEPRGNSPKQNFWPAHSAKGTLDRVTCMLPKLYAQRLREAGVDFATLYPTFGFRVFRTSDPELRRGLARALNMMYADMFRDVRHYMTPAAVIPMHTPSEAHDRA